MKKSCAFFACVSAFIAGCDLQPRIVALPDTVGDFISARYPALLADPVAQADIYNSAATDYGVYASPELYGTGTTDDYVLYASVNDYIVPPTDADVSTPVSESPDIDTGAPIFAENSTPPEPRVADGPDVPPMETDSADVIDVPPAPSVAAAASPTAQADDVEFPGTTNPGDVLNIPMYGGRKELLTVIPGDTLYSIARQNATTVEELAAINNLTPPYDIRVGQKLYLIQAPTNITVPAKPAAAGATTQSSATQTKPAATTTTQTQASAAPAAKPAQNAPAKPEVPPAAKPATPQVATTTRVDLTEIIITPGDTLYSLSRAYSVPVNDLAVMNNLTPPFALYAGQKVKVPNLSNAPVRSAATMPDAAAATPANNTAATKTSNTATNKASASAAKTDSKTADKTTAQQTKTDTAASKNATASANTTPKPKEKISSDPSKKLPAIAARSSSKFSWPVRGSILSGYGAKSSGLFNDGINISASKGTTVKAAENGVVAYAGNEVKGMGNLVIIQHSDGFMTVYAHMDTLAVRRGAKVAVGQKIGTVGATGKVDKPQLHFEIRKGTKAYNPTQYLKK